MREGLNTYIRVGCGGRRFADLCSIFISDLDGGGVLIFMFWLFCGVVVGEGLQIYVQYLYPIWKLLPACVIFKSMSFLKIFTVICMHINILSKLLQKTELSYSKKRSFLFFFHKIKENYRSIQF